MKRVLAAIGALALTACDFTGKSFIVSPLRLTPAIVPATVPPVPLTFVSPALSDTAASDAGATLAGAPPPETTALPSPSGATAQPDTPTPEPTSPTEVLQGMVYDEQGRPVDGATVSVRSLDSTVPYTGRANTAQGSWVINNVPNGLNIEVTAAKAGWTTRRRVGTFLAPGNPVYKLDFGAVPQPDPNGDAAGVPLFLSTYPEVVSAAIGPGIGSGRLAVKLTLSEALDVADQQRFTEAVRFLPANDAAGASTPGDLTNQVLAPDFTIADDQPRLIKTGTTFQGDANLHADVTWDATGTVASLNFDGRLLTTGGGAMYQVALVAGAGVVADPDGNPLGMTPDGTWPGHDAPAGQLVRHAFLSPALALITGADSGASRWASTHADAIEVDPSKAYQSP